MSVNQPAFRAVPAGTVNLAATTTTSRVQVQSGRENRHLRLFNSGSVAVFVEVGDSTVTAVLATAIPIAPGAVEIISCGETHIAGITASGTATLYATPGEGL